MSKRQNKKKVCDDDDDDGVGRMGEETGRRRRRQGIDRSKGKVCRLGLVVDYVGGLELVLPCEDEYEGIETVLWLSGVIREKGGSGCAGSSLGLMDNTPGVRLWTTERGEVM